MKKINVAIIGQGRSGRDIHGKYFRSEANENFVVTDVVDYDKERRERAEKEYPGCRVWDSYKALYGRDDIDVVVNSSYSDEHFEVTRDLLENGFNVIVEKPFARTKFECDTLIRLAKENKVMLAVFQQTFFAPFYNFAKDVIKSGKLGDIMQVDITYSGFSRRWDWQTLQKRVGGNIYNTGPHPIGLALGFLDFDDNARVAFSKLETVMISGDSDGYSKIILTAPDKPVVDIEINSNDAYPAANVKILGSKGTLKTTIGEYEMKYIKYGENPEKPALSNFIKKEDGLPAYCSEKLITHEESGEHEGDAFEFSTKAYYDMIYKRLVNDEPLTVTPEHASKIISVIETAHAQNPLPVKF